MTVFLLDAHDLVTHWLHADHFLVPAGHELTLLVSIKSLMRRDEVVCIAQNILEMMRQGQPSWLAVMNFSAVVQLFANIPKLSTIGT